MHGSAFRPGLSAHCQIRGHPPCAPAHTDACRWGCLCGLTLLPLAIRKAGAGSRRNSSGLLPPLTADDDEPPPDVTRDLTATFEGMNLDVHLLIASALGPKDLLSLSSVCHETVEVARTDALWRFHLDALRQQHPHITCVTFGYCDLRTYEQYLDWMECVLGTRARRDAEMLDDFANLKNGCPFTSQAKYGEISGAFTDSASFDSACVHGERR